MTINKDFPVDASAQASSGSDQRPRSDPHRAQYEGRSAFRFGDAGGYQRIEPNMTPLDTTGHSAEEVCPKWRERPAMTRASTSMGDMSGLPLSSTADCVVLLNTVLECLDEVLPLKTPEEADRYALAATHLQQVIDLLD